LTLATARILKERAADRRPPLLVKSIDLAMGQDDREFDQRRFVERCAFDRNSFRLRQTYQPPAVCQATVDAG
jgi:hypothetical protein